MADKHTTPELLNAAFVTTLPAQNRERCRFLQAVGCFRRGADLLFQGRFALLAINQPLLCQALHWGITETDPYKAFIDPASPVIPEG